MQSLATLVHRSGKATILSEFVLAVGGSDTIQMLNFHDLAHVAKTHLLSGQVYQ